MAPQDPAPGPVPDRPTPPRRRKNAEVRVREHLTEPEVMSLIAAARKLGAYGHRNACLILIGFRHGLRVSELVELRWEQIDLEARTLYVRRLKGSKPSQHTMERDEVTALRKLDPRPAGIVFVSARGDALSRRTVGHVLAEAAAAAKVPLKVHPHMLRHACGYCLANRGADTRMIQDWLGHRQIQHTVRYTELNPERFRSLWGRRPA